MIVGVSRTAQGHIDPRPAFEGPTFYLNQTSGLAQWYRTEFTCVNHLVDKRDDDQRCAPPLRAEPGGMRTKGTKTTGKARANPLAGLEMPAASKTPQARGQAERGDRSATTPAQTRSKGQAPGQPAASKSDKARRSLRFQRNHTERGRPQTRRESRHAQQHLRAKCPAEQGHAKR